MVRNQKKGKAYTCNICHGIFQCNQMGTSYLNARKGHNSSIEHRKALQALKDSGDTSAGEIIDHGAEDEEEEEEESEGERGDDGNYDDGGDDHFDGIDSSMDKLELRDDDDDHSEDDRERESMGDDDDVDESDGDKDGSVDGYEMRGYEDESEKVFEDRSSRVSRSCIRDNEIWRVQTVLLKTLYYNNPANFNKVYGVVVDVELALDMLEKMEDFHMTEKEGDEFVSFEIRIIERILKRPCRRRE